MAQNFSVNFFRGMNPSYNNVQKDMFGRKLRSADMGPASILTGTFDPIEQKRAIARKRASKIIDDAFAGEKKIDEDVKNRMDLIKHYESMMGEANRKLAEIDEGKETLRQEYGVDPDSQEQKDLKLLEQYHRITKMPSPEERKLAIELMPSEDWQRTMDLVNQGYSGGYTEYQQRALELEQGRDVHLDHLRKAQKGLIEENAAIRGINQERLKHHTMVDAVGQSEEILENAGKEIMGMLVDEAVDHIDEKSEEEIEKAEEKKEEKKEEQEKLEEARERREEMEALADPEKAEKEHKRTEDESDSMYGDVLTEALLKMDGVKNDVQKEVADMVSKMKLAAEDLKGLKVDELL